MSSCAASAPCSRDRTGCCRSPSARASPRRPLRSCSRGARCLQAFEQVLGVKPLLVRTGGTLPIVPALADKGIPTVLTGFALPESNVHSPNERFLVRYFASGVDTAAALYTKFGELPRD